jgi:hypothetical protein
MFEIVITYRPDFTEQVLDRYPTLEDARAVARRLSEERHDQVIRIWVRQVREARTKK